MLQFIVETPQRLKEFTDNHYPQASFVFRTLLKDKEIKVNGKKIGEDILLQAGDTVAYFLTKKQEEKVPFDTVYQDENVHIIDKTSGVNAEAVYATLKRLYGNHYKFIHRLDRNTKGLLVFALNETMEQLLLTAFKNHCVEKRYHALCEGSFKKPKDILTAYLVKDEEKSLVKIYDTKVQGSEKIITEYAVLEELDGLSKVEICLHTGKTHQIRAHLAHISHPILGDNKYGNPTLNKLYNCKRQCLVAKSLKFNLTGAGIYLNEKIFYSRFNEKD